MISPLKARGFRSRRHFERAVAGVDLSTTMQQMRFKRWQALDGTAAGLRRLNAPRRLSNWQAALHQFIESRRHEPFAWARQDCCLFACDGILAQTGFDPAAKLFRGKYRDALGAARLVRKHGGVEAIAAKVCAANDWPELPTPLLAQRGDVVLLPMPHDPMQHGLGLCLGSECAFPGEKGLLFHPLSACTRAWAVARNRT